MVSGNPDSRSEDAVHRPSDAAETPAAEFSAEPILPHEPPVAAFDPGEPPPPPREAIPDEEPPTPPRNTYSPPAPPEPSRAQPLLAGVAGGVLVLAISGALYLTGVIGPKPAGTSSDPAAADPAVTARLADIETQIHKLATRPAATSPDAAAAPAADGRIIDDLKARLTALETAPPAGPASSAPADPALASRIAKIEGSLAALTDIMTRLDRQGDAVAAQAQNAERRVSELSDTLTKAGPGGAAERGDVDKLAARVSKLEGAAKGLEDDLAKRAVVGAMDRQLRVAYVAEALRSAAERGAPFAGPLSALVVLAPENKSLADLKVYAQTGVPSEAALAQELSGLMPAVQRLAQPQGGDTPSILDRLKANAEKLVELRTISATDGNDPAAVASRIAASANKADIAGALADLAKLPPQVRAPAEAWISKAQARQNTVTLARRFASEAMAALGPAAP